MKLLINCQKCLSDESIPLSERSKYQNYNESGQYDYTCSKGHVTAGILLNNKFEILFDMGVHAILDGYYREAVVNFTSCLERFYEYAIKIISHSHDVNYQEIDEAWRPIKSQSERQLGAYIFIYFQTFKKVPNTLNQKWTTYRNNVIHKGEITNKKKAMEYGNLILKIIQPVIKDIKLDYTDCIHDYLNYRINLLKDKIEGKTLIYHPNISTIINDLTGPRYNASINLEDEILKFNIQKRLQSDA